MFNKKLKRTVAWILLIAMIVSNNSFVSFAEKMQEDIKSETENKDLEKYYDDYTDEEFSASVKNDDELSSIDEDIVIDEPEILDGEINSEEIISPENSNEQNEEEYIDETEVEIDDEEKNNQNENEQEQEIEIEIDIDIESNTNEEKNIESEEKIEKENDGLDISTESQIDEEEIEKTLDDINEFLGSNQREINDFDVEGHVHKLCGLTINDLCSHSFGTQHRTVMEYTPWDGTVEISRGAYYLSKDVEYNQDIVVDGFLFICLNGHNLNMKKNTIISYEDKANVIISDCSDLPEVIVRSEKPYEPLFLDVSLICYKEIGDLIFNVGLLLDEKDYKCNVTLEKGSIKEYREEKEIKVGRSNKVGAETEYFLLDGAKTGSEYWYIRNSGLFEYEGESLNTIGDLGNKGYLYLYAGGCPVFRGNFLFENMNTTYGVLVFNDIQATTVEVPIGFDDTTGLPIFRDVRKEPQVKGLKFVNCVATNAPIFVVRNADLRILEQAVEFTGCRGEGAIFAIEQGKVISLANGASIKITNCRVMDITANEETDDGPQVAAFYLSAKTSERFQGDDKVEVRNGTIIITNNVIISNRKNKFAASGMYLDAKFMMGSGHLQIYDNEIKNEIGVADPNYYCHQLLLETTDCIAFRNGQMDLAQTKIQVAIRSGSHSGPFAQNYSSSNIQNIQTTPEGVNMYISADPYYNPKFEVYMMQARSAEFNYEYMYLFIGITPANVDYTIQFDKGIVPLASDGNNYQQNVEGECSPIGVRGYNIATLSTGYSLTGFLQVGWSLSNDSREAEYSLGERVVQLGHTAENPIAEGEIITLYAVWQEKSYSVEFEDLVSVDEIGNYVDNTKTATIMYYEALNISTFSFAYTGITLESWTLVSSDDEKIATGSVYSTNATLLKFTEENQAKFVFAPNITRAWYRISYNPNYPVREEPYITSGSMATQICSYNLKETLYKNEFSVEGFTFVGWSTVEIKTYEEEVKDAIAYEDRREIINIGAPGTITNLYAVWVEDIYTVVFVDNKPTEEMSDIKYERIGFTTMITAPAEAEFSYAEKIVSGYRFSKLVIPNDAGIPIELIQEYGATNIDSTGAIILKENIDYKVYRELIFPGQSYSGFLSIINENIRDLNLVAYYSAIYTIGEYEARFHPNPPKNVNGLHYVTDVVMEPIRVDMRNNPYIGPAQYEFENYKFLYWMVDSTSSDATKIINTGNGYFVGDLTPKEGSNVIDFYAAWEPYKYKIKYKKGNPNVPDTPTMVDEEKEYDKKYRVITTANNQFAYEDHTLSYFVIDEIRDANNQSIAVSERKVFYPNQTEYSNLINIDNATIYLKAVWDGPNAGYKVVFDNNVPAAAKDKVVGSMETLEFAGSETKVITGNIELNGYTLVGFGFNSNDSIPSYRIGDSVFALGSNNETIVLYAIWRKNGGYINFDPGHNAFDNAAQDPMYVDPDNERNEIPRPIYEYNRGNYEFSHYIILSMQDGQGNIITEEQFEEQDLMKKIYPGDDAASLIRGNGYIVTLQMIYNEKYEVVYLAEDITDNDGIVHEITPKEEKQSIKINDRDYLVAPSYLITNGGYSFSGKFVNNGVTYEAGQIVKGLCSEPGEQFRLTAQFKISVYYVDFIPGGPVGSDIVSGVINTMEKTVERKYNEVYDLSNQYVWTGHIVQYFVIDKITAKDGSNIEFDFSSQRKITTTYMNLTGVDEATVTLRAVWSEFKYSLLYDANAPEGTMATGEVQGLININNYDDIVIAENDFVIEGYTFLGWSKNKNATKPSYYPNDIVYAFSNGIETTVYLYAVWEKRTGTIKYNLGYDPIQTEVMPDQDTTIEGLVREPAEVYNRHSHEFLYYKIYEIKNSNNEQYELTREEKLKIVHPGDDASLLFRKKGDVLTLIKIYNVSYKVFFQASAREDSDHRVHDVIIPPSGQYEIQIYINDTTVVPEFTFKMDAYEFINLYRHARDDSLEFYTGDVIGNLTNVPNDAVFLQAQFKPVQYYIRYDRGLNVVMGDNMDDTTANYDEDVKLRDIAYYYPNHHAVYWIKDRMVYQDGSYYEYKTTERATYSIPQVGDASTIVKNIATVSKATVILRAVWEADLEEDDSTTYKIVFDANLPKGYTLNNPLATMPQIFVRGGEIKQVPANVWEANGLSFKGWSIHGSKSEQVDYVEGDLIYGLMSRERETIVFYGIWDAIDGKAVIKPGHNPQDGDVEKTYDIDKDAYVPIPEYGSNANVEPTSDFLYYIIDSIVDSEGEPYELTDDEKLLKIDPNKEIALGSFIKNPGDTVNLLKIYNEPYKVKFTADKITSKDDVKWVPTPEEYVQYIYVNDRERLGVDKDENLDVKFTWDGGYIFNEEFDYQGGVYQKGEIVEKLAIQRDTTVDFKARHKSIKYNIVFDPGTETVRDRNVMAGLININYDEETPTIANQFWTDDGYTIDCFLVSKVTKDGKEIFSDKINQRIENNSKAINLTYVDGAVVTLRAMWKELKYYIGFDPNVPTGYALTEDIRMATMSFAGAEKKTLIPNEYKIKGLSFLGWATQSDATTIDYEDEEEIIALGNENGDMFIFYAVWGFTSGNMKFDVGHEPKINDVMEDVPIKSTEDTLVPNPPEQTNRNNDDFLYYIIKSITPKDSDTAYELTDDEKLAKIYPGESASTFLREEGDTIELLKIYNEPYTLLLKGGRKTSLDGKELIGTPAEIRQTIYVNDRERFGYDESENITDVNFVMEAYNYDGTFTDTNGTKTYRVYNDIVEKLVPQKGMTYQVVANYYPNRYFIKYDRGSDDLDANGEYIVKYQMNDPNAKRYDTTYYAPTNNYSWAGHSPLYYVVDGVITADNIVVPPKDFERKKILQNASYYNLTNIASATVVLKVVWSNTSYVVRYNPNVPNGAQLSENSRTLESQTIQNGDSFYMPNGKDYYIVPGFTFKGWTTNPSSYEVMYESGKEMYGMAKNEKDTVIDFYAVWEKIGGFIDFDLGHNPKPTEEPPEVIDTGTGEATMIPNPNELENNDEKPFLYYIIRDIVPYGGTNDDAYELTDEEKLLKIDPRIDEVEASTLLRNNGDTVTLIKIYDEPYTIYMMGGKKEDSEGVVHIATPERCEQTTYVNDRIRLIDPQFKMETGYKFNKKFITKTMNNSVIEYKVGQIVEKLVPEEGGVYTSGLSYTMDATYDPIEYYVEYNAGNTDFTEEEQNKMVNNKAKYAFDMSAQPAVVNYRWTNHPFEYWVVDKIELEDGTKLKSKEFTRKKVNPYPATFKNLINIASATVTLKAVWRNNDYTIYFNPNVPNGSTLLHQITMEPQSVTSNNGVALRKNEYEIKGKSFVGWSLSPTNDDYMFEDEEVVYGLATRENDEIDLYAMWIDKTGTIEFDMGHNPVPGETLGPINTDEVKIIPRPNENRNNDGDDFLYYIIEEIKPAATDENPNPEPYELTDEEKLLKIDPQDDIESNSLLRNNGDTVKLIKIYNEPYDVIMRGGEVKDIVSYNNQYEPEYSTETRLASPNEIRQSIYVNDRQRIITPSYVLSGYNFDNKFKAEDNTIIHTGQIVEKLASVKGGEYEVTAQYKPIEYSIGYEKGSTAISNTMPDTTRVPYNSIKRLSGNSFIYPNHTFLEHVQERIEYPNGEVKIMPNAERKVYGARQGVFNLTNVEGARVVLKSVWSGVNYSLRFNANVPIGYTLDSSSKPMENQSFTENEKKKIASNSFVISGLSFKGWATYSTAKEVYIKDGEVVYDMANRENDVIDLYAIWYNTKGIVKFDPGHNPKPGDITEDIDTSIDEDAVIPIPLKEYQENQSEAPFLYYIIDNIVSKDGEPYELTEDELLMKIDPNADEDILASSLMKADGDVVTLMKIYNEPYYLNKLGGEKEINGVQVYGKLANGETIERQVIYINDRERIEPSYFTLADGFSFNETFTYQGEDEDIIYKIGQIVRGLCQVENGDYNITANYDEVSYKVKLLGGSDKVINQKEVDIDITKNYFTNVIVDGEYVIIAYNQQPAPIINSNPFNYNNDNLKRVEYFVVDKIETKEGIELINNQIDRKKIYINQPFNNLTTMSEATVYLKAVWTDLVYYIAYDENLPDGFLLTDAEAQKALMQPTKVTGGEEVKLASNSFVANGLSFKGWNTEKATDSILYRDEEVVFALAKAENETITLYAIWQKKTGVVQFDLGHLPRSDDRQDPIYADSVNDRIPSPNRLSNSQNDNFLYYIIKDIKPMATVENPNPEPYDLTDDELLLKIDPVQKDTRVASLLREDGDVVTLIKIYDEPYDLKLKGGKQLDSNGNEILGSPSEIIQKIYVNDRQRIGSVSYALDGYQFANTFVDAANKTYKIGDIVEKLVPNKGGTYGMDAQYDPNEYYLKFRSSITGVTNPESMDPPLLPTPVAKYNVSTTVPRNSYNAPGKSFAYWVQDAVTKANGVSLGYKDFNRTVISDGGSFINLTYYDKATVTLKAIWNGVQYRVSFRPNFPEGATVDNPNDEIESLNMVCNSIINNEKKPVPNSIWNVNEYYFEGWAVDSNAEEAEFLVGDQIYGMPYGYEEGYELVLYAVWKKSRGTIKFDPGHNSNDIMDEQDIGEPVKHPREVQNDSGDDFLYYIIKDIRPKGGTADDAYELTDEEKLVKIYPGDNLKDYLRENGDEITLLKIYNEPYDVVYKGDRDENGNMRPFSVEPTTDYVQKIYVNDRARLSTASVYKTSGGYRFNNEYVSGAGTRYKLGDIVEKLAGAKGATFNLYAQYEPVYYYINYIPGDVAVSNPLSMDSNSPQILRKCAFNTSYNVPTNYYYNQGRTFVGWVVEKIVKEDGTYVPFRDMERKLLYTGQNQTFINLTTYENATVTLKALWSGLKYTIKYEPNILNGYTLTSTTSMPDSEYVGAEARALAKNTYTSRGASFVGWATSATATEYAFVDEEVVYGLGNRNNDIITLYAIWRKLEGKISFDLGDNPNTNEEAIDPIDVKGDDDQWIPRPGRNGSSNAEGDDFLYYIIKSITPYGSDTPYDLTDEEKLLKIDPNLDEQIAAGSVIRNDGDEVKLLKIYNSPYEIIVNTNVPESINGIENVVVPAGYRQEIYVNDRERLEFPNFTMEGYTLNSYVAGDGSNRVFEQNEIVEKLCPVKYGQYEIKLMWRGNTYKVVFDKGVESAVENPKVVFNENNAYGTRYPLPDITCSLENNKIQYLLVTKIIKENGEEATQFRRATVSIPPENDTSGDIYYYANLSTFSNSIVTLTAVWLKDNINVIYHPGHNGIGRINMDDADNVAVADPAGQIANSEGRPFKYWIIATMHTIPKEGEQPQPVEFTDDLKLLKIPPGTPFSSIANLNDVLLELIAIYDEPYTVNIRGNAPGTNVTSPSNIAFPLDVNDRARLPKDKFKLGGYNLNGYAESQTGPVAYYEDEIVEKLRSDAGQEKQLYGNWSPISYKVGFESNDSGVVVSGDITPINANYDSEYIIPANLYTRRGYELTGWKVSSIAAEDGTALGVERASQEEIKLESDGTARVRNLTKYGNSEVKLTPTWKGLPYTITFDANGGGKTATGATQSVIIATHGEAFTLTQVFNPDSANTYISSYNTDANGNGTSFDLRTYQTGLTDDDAIFLYARWSRTNTNNNSGNSNNPGGGSSRGGSSGAGALNSLNQQPAVQGPLTDQTLYNQGTWVYRDTIDKWQYAANLNNIFTNNNDFFNNGNTYSINNYSFETDASVLYLADGFYRIGWNDGEQIFEFDKEGYMKTGFTEANGEIYYLLSTSLNKGAIAKGTVNINGRMYNFDTTTGALIKDGETVECKAGGMWVYEPNTDRWRYQKNTHGSQPAEYLAGDMFRIYGQDSEDYFMFDANGYMMTGNITYKGNSYYMLESGGRRGALAYDKDTSGRVSYLFNNQGVLVAQVNEAANRTGWVQNTQTDGWQYLETNQMGQVLPLTNTYRRLESNGGYYDYIFDSKGNMQTGLTQYNGYIYYLEEKGANIGTVQTGERIIDGSTYVFGSDGTLRSKDGVVYNYGLPLP